MTTATETTTDRRTEYTAGLRMLADLLDANPNLRLPGDGNSDYQPITVFVTNGEDQRANLAAWVRALPGKKTKKEEGTGGAYLGLRALLRGLHFRVLADRDEVCERIVIGTREVTEDRPDPALLAEIPLITTTRTEEIVEWRCSSILDEASA